MRLAPFSSRLIWFISFILAGLAVVTVLLFTDQYRVPTGSEEALLLPSSIPLDTLPPPHGSLIASNDRNADLTTSFNAALVTIARRAAQQFGTIETVTVKHTEWKDSLYAAVIVRFDMWEDPSGGLDGYYSVMDIYRIQQQEALPLARILGYWGLEFYDKPHQGFADRNCNNLPDIAVRSWTAGNCLGSCNVLRLLELTADGHVTEIGLPFNVAPFPKALEDLNNDGCFELEAGDAWVVDHVPHADEPYVRYWYAWDDGRYHDISPEQAAYYHEEIATHREAIESTYGKPFTWDVYSTVASHGLTLLLQYEAMGSLAKGWNVFHALVSQDHWPRASDGQRLSDRAIPSRQEHPSPRQTFETHVSRIQEYISSGNEPLTSLSVIEESSNGQGS